MHMYVYIHIVLLASILSSVRNKVAKVVGQMSEHFEFGLDIFNLGRTLFVWIFMPHNAT